MKESQKLRLCKKQGSHKMLYGLEYVNKHPIYKLHEVVEFFFESGLNQPAFGNDCFPLWFVPVLKECPVLKEKFCKIFSAVIKLNSETRKALFDIWKCQRQIRELCGNIKLNPKYSNIIKKDLNNSIKDLFNTLYDETLGRASFQQAVGTTFEEHYKAFRELGQRVCPFCGMHNYRDRGKNSRASYDHYLPRKYYPFAAVNFQNLIPMCDECNQPPNKGATDLLFQDKNRTKRRKCYYPYDKPGGIIFEITSLKRARLGEPGKLKVTAKPKSKKDAQPVAAWKAVFCIERRYERRLHEESEEWIKDFLNSKAYITPPSIKILREDFKNKSVWLNEPDQLRLHSNSAIKAAYFHFLATKAMDDELAGFVGISTLAAVAQVGAASFSRSLKIS